MKSSTEGMYELDKCDNIKIDTANGSTSSVTYIGKYKGDVLCADGKIKKIVMKDVKVVPHEKSVFTFYSDAKWLGTVNWN